MKNISKAFLILSALFVLILVGATAASAVNLDIKSLKINGDDISNDSINLYQRGEKLNVRVCVVALAEVRDAVIDAEFFGYRYAKSDPAKTSDESDVFNLPINNSICRTLNLEIPTRMDFDQYKLRVRVADRDGIARDETYELNIEGADQSKAVIIKDYTFNPEEVIAGRAFTAQVKVRNIGDNDLSDLKLTMSIPDLDVKVSEYMTSLDSDESKTFEELLLRIPECTKAGTYDVNLHVDFDEYESVEETEQMTVKTGENCAGQTSPDSQQNLPSMTTISVPGSQEIIAGTSVVYPVLIRNDAGSQKSYTLTISGVSEWATTRVEPGNIVLVPAGQSRTVYIYVNANKDATLGDKIFTLNIDTDSESKQTPISAKIVKGAATNTANWDSMKTGLEIGLIVLVIILIILGLLIGFRKVKDTKQDSDPYY